MTELAPWDGAWREVGEASVDARRRLSLGSAGLPEHFRYQVWNNLDGDILLIPLVSLTVAEHAALLADLRSES